MFRNPCRLGLVRRLAGVVCGDRRQAGYSSSGSSSPECFCSTTGSGCRDCRRAGGRGRGAGIAGEPPPIYLEWRRGEGKDGRGHRTTGGRRWRGIVSSVACGWGWVVSERRRKISSVACSKGTLLTLDIYPLGLLWWFWRGASFSVRCECDLRGSCVHTTQPAVKLYRRYTYNNNHRIHLDACSVRRSELKVSEETKFKNKQKTI